VGESAPAVRIIRSIPTAYRVALIALALLALVLLAITVRAWQRSLRAERAALVDALTGVANRQAFERYLTAEWTRAGRYRRALGLLLLDIDGLKQVNDDQGHAAGDRVLRGAASSISARVRESDIVARIGGDEFVVICPETRAAGLERLARALEEDFEQLPVGISVGFAERESGDEQSADLLSRADAAMYRHKRARQGGLRGRGLGVGIGEAAAGRGR
jgi:diguanylate cyclase (GGDEF)-like protein